MTYWSVRSLGFTAFKIVEKLAGKSLSLVNLKKLQKQMCATYDATTGVINGLCVLPQTKTPASLPGFRILVTA
ncbi:MAG: hypothetical protein IJJ28_01590 [Lentisphaeria bacterium]|nr:hypothetical protein [Lentisphaeria bacterium]